MAEKKGDKAPEKQEADKAPKEEQKQPAKPAPEKEQEGASEKNSGCDCQETMQDFYELLSACKDLVEKDKKKRGIQQGNPHVAEFEGFFTHFLKKHESE